MPPYGRPQAGKIQIGGRLPLKTFFDLETPMCRNVGQTNNNCNTANCNDSFFQTYDPDLRPQIVGKITCKLTYNDATKFDFSSNEPPGLARFIISDFPKKPDDLYQKETSNKRYNFTANLYKANGLLASDRNGFSDVLIKMYFCIRKSIPGFKKRGKIARSTENARKSVKNS